jgi:hypothetical protein
MSFWRSPEQSGILNNFYFAGWPLAKFGSFLLSMIASPLDKIGEKKTQKQNP